MCRRLKIRESLVFIMQLSLVRALITEWLLNLSKRGQIFKISEVKAQILPPIFSLVDLMNDKIKQNFYAEQLTKAPNPNTEQNLFAVERVLHTKKIRGVKYYKCRFLYYPPKFDQYIKESDMVFGKK